MHPNPTFRSASDAKNLNFAKERGFGVLACNGPDLPLLAHVPFHMAPDQRHIDIHLMRSNPIAVSVKTEIPAVMAVSGPDGYISPDWYLIEDQVPTWNYVAVHLQGKLERRPDSELRQIIDSLSDNFEARLAPKPIWTSSKMPAEVMERMMRMIVPYRLNIKTVQGTWKLGQNKTDAARLAAADQLPNSGIGQELLLLSELMRRSRTPE